MSSFRILLSEVDWSEVWNEDVDCSLEDFIPRIQLFFCDCIFIRTTLITENTLENPWLTFYLTKLIDLKSKYVKIMKAIIVTKIKSNFS